MHSLNKTMVSTYYVLGTEDIIYSEQDLIPVYGEICKKSNR